MSFYCCEGITKRFDKEDRNAESAYQGYIPREELSIFDEPDLCPKRQQTTGAFSEASLVRYCFFFVPCFS
jgi:hypothetical protein